jgi:hypothetical protein
VGRSWKLQRKLLLLAMLLAVAGCNKDEEPMGPDGDDPSEEVVEFITPHSSAERGTLARPIGYRGRAGARPLFTRDE